MPSILAIVSKKVFSKECPSAAVGALYETSIYRSAHKALAGLQEGGDIYLVTVRSPGEQMWLVGVLRSPKKEDGGWCATNTTPIADVSALRTTIKFESGKGISQKEGALGMSLQTPRALSEADVVLLEASIGVGKGKTKKPTHPTKATKVTKAKKAKKAPTKKKADVPNPPTHKPAAPQSVIHYSKEARKYLWPRTREDVEVRAKAKKTVKALWKKLTGRYGFEAPDIASSVGLEDEAERAAMLIQPTEPASLDARHGSLLLVALGDDSLNACCEYLVERIGLLDALEALIGAHGLRLETRPRRFVEAGEDRRPMIQEALFDAYLVADEDVQKSYIGRVEEVYQGAPLPLRLALLACMRTRDTWANELGKEFLEVGAQYEGTNLLMYTMSDPALSTRLAQQFVVRAPVVNIVPPLGEKAVPLLAQLLDERSEYPSEQIGCSRAIGCIGTADAAAAFALHLRKKNVRPAATEFFAQFPHLAPAALSELAKKKTKVAATAREILKNVERATAQAGVEIADEEEVPEILREPPWHSAERQKRKPVTVKDLTVPIEPMQLHWPDASRRDFTARTFARSGVLQNEAACATLKAKVAEGKGGYLYGNLPADITIPYLENPPDGFTIRSETPMTVLAFEGKPALRGMLMALARGDGQPEANVFMHLESPAVAAYILRRSTWTHFLYYGLKWFEKYPAAAAAGVVPLAAGPKGGMRIRAEGALRYLARRGHRKTILSAAKSNGAKCAESIDEILAADEREVCPKKPPKMPTFFRPKELRPPKLKNGKALPVWAVQRLGEMLRFSHEKWPYVGIDEIRDACDARSLAEHAWDLAQAWDTNGAKDSQDWMLYAVLHFGDDEVVRRLTPALRGEGIGMMLGQIGTDAACMELQTIEARLSAAKVKVAPKYARGAKASMLYVAAERGLSEDELADQFVATYDVDENSSIALDLGTKTYRGRFDLQLRPQLIDDKGAAVRSLPSAAKVDAEAHAKATTRWTDLKEDVSVLAHLRSLALERAMLDERAWTLEEHRRLWVDHPLMIHFARATVWTAIDEQGSAVETFRVADDRSFATRSDDEWKPKKAHRIRVAHPGEWTPETHEQWTAVFDDYELLSPFGQFDRKPPDFSDEELASHTLGAPNPKDFDRWTATLHSQGWHGGLPARAFPSDTFLQVHRDGGESLALVPYRHRRRCTFGEIGPALRSEARHVFALP